MGHGAESNYHAVLVDQDGRPVAEFTSSDGVMEVDVRGIAGAEAMIAGELGPLALSLNISIPKEWRCGSRKRFIKLLMSYGCSRNDAAGIAFVFRNHARYHMLQRSYQQLFFLAMILFLELQTANDGKEG